MAQRNGVYALSIGLEFKLLSPLTDQWLQLIRDIRAVYTGQLTYCAEATSQEHHHIRFWPELDFIGLDLYIPFVLSRSPNANLIQTRDEMVGNYTLLFKPRIIDWYKSSNLSLPMILTETGYPSSNWGMQNPWLLPNTPCLGDQAPNFTAQLVATEIHLSALGNPDYTNYFGGVFVFWRSSPGCPDLYEDRFSDPANQWGCSWSLIGKPALQVVRQWFARDAVPTSAPSSSPLASTSKVPIIVFSCLGAAAVIGIIAYFYNRWLMQQAQIRDASSSHNSYYLLSS
jgi:hypothetical protein